MEQQHDGTKSTRSAPGRLAAAIALPGWCGLPGRGRRRGQLGGPLQARHQFVGGDPQAIGLVGEFTQPLDDGIVIAVRHAQQYIDPSATNDDGPFVPAGDI